MKTRGLLAIVAMLAACRESAPIAPHDPPHAHDAASADVPPVDAGTPTPAPTWAEGDLPQRLRALGVHDDDWARRDLYSWTTKVQVDALRTSHVLLVATANTGGPPSPFIYLVSGLAARKSDVGAVARLLATDSRFLRRRYAWTAAYATVLGLLQKRYGDELVHVRLAPDAYVLELDPSLTPPLRARDLAQRDVPLADVLAHPERIGAVYHVRKGSDVPRPFREYVLVNEGAIERWAVGTPDVVAEVDAEMSLLRDLRASLDADAGAPLGAWRATLAFDNDRYGKLDVRHVDRIVEGLATYVRDEPPIEHGAP